MTYSYLIKYLKVLFRCLPFVGSTIVEFNIRRVLSTNMTQPEIVIEVRRVADDHIIKTQDLNEAWQVILI